MRNLNEKPRVGTRVAIYYNETDNRDGIWNGEKWQFRKPYTKDEYIDIPASCVLKGWEYCEREAYCF